MAVPLQRFQQLAKPTAGADTRSSAAPAVARACPEMYPSRNEIKRPTCATNGGDCSLLEAVRIHLGVGAALL